MRREIFTLILAFLVAFISFPALAQPSLKIVAVDTEKALEESIWVKKTIEKLEKESIIQALIRNRWNVSRSSKELGISRWTVNDLIKKYHIEKEL